MKLFINYKRNVEPDQTLARELERLLAPQHEVFRDETGIHSGSLWAQRIQDAIEWCEVMISLVSNASLQSEWVLNEIDFAQKRQRMIIPILLETLEESLEFQDYIPRFRRVQHFVYRGSAEQAASDICRRLEHGATILDARTAVDRWFRFDTTDDSENPHWRAFLKEHCPRNAAGGYVLSLGAAVRLAALRSRYYQRAARALEPANGQTDAEPKTQAEPKVQTEPQAVEAFRRCFFTQVAIGDFGSTGFSSGWGGHESVGATMPGFVALLSQQIEITDDEQLLEPLKKSVEINQAIYQTGRNDASGLGRALQGLDAAHGRIARARLEFANAMDDFQTYTLGVPSDAEIVLDDSLAPHLEFVDPEIEAMCDRLDKFFDFGGYGERREPDFFGTTRAIRDTCRLAATRLDALQPVVDWLLVSAGLPTTPVPAPEEQIPWSPLPESAYIAPPATDVPEEAEVQELIPSLERSQVEMARIRRELEKLTESEAQLTQQIPEVWQEPLNRASDVLQSIDRLQAMTRVACLKQEPLELSLEAAEAIAARHRPDAGLLEHNAALRRTVRNNLRRALREYVRGVEYAETCRSQVNHSLSLALQARIRWRVGVATLLVVQEANTELGRVVTQLRRCWLALYASRLRLTRELGLIELDEHGVWIDQSLNAAVTQALQDDSPGS